jgi:hypothetical protein
MTDYRDLSLDVLLNLDGQTIIVDPEGKYWVKFIVKQVPPSPDRPHGLSYSLTLHDETGVRLVGFDNAHAPPAKKGRARRVTKDHRHRLRTIRLYERCCHSARGFLGRGRKGSKGKRSVGHDDIESGHCDP